MTDRKKPTAGFWITVALVAALVAYPLSFGPACWITSRMSVETSAIGVIYRPIVRFMSWTDGGSVLGTILDQYSRLGAADDWHWMRVDLFGPDPGRPAYIWVCFKK